MTRILNKAPVRPSRPRFWRKGVLAFALACLTLWGAMLAAGGSSPHPAALAHSYSAEGAAWQGITRIDLRALEGSDKIVLTPASQLRIETAWDEPAQPRLQLQRQGDTLVLRPQPGRDKQDHYRSLRVSKIFLPASILSIQGRNLNLDFAAPQAGFAPLLRLEAQGLDVRGSPRQLQIQLQFADAKQAAACTLPPYARTRLNVYVQAVEQLDIHAPDGSRIELYIAAEHLQQLGTIKLQTGASSRLQLGSMALWNKIHLQPLPTPTNCRQGSSADDSSDRAEDDYSD